jgi:CRISPR-associated protein Cst2
MNLKSLSISAKATLELHALNNEGAEGNALMTRMVDIVDQEGRLHTVNAVSGDMLKHIQAEHLFQHAVENKLPLCNGCLKFDANRICADEEFTKRKDFTKETPDSVILGEALKKCVIDDMEGILITSEIGKSRSIARKSCVEFGWAVGIPDRVHTESYFHAKYVPEGRGKGSGAGENLGQNIFHRPASSGQYAIVANLDPLRVGRNDITLEYAVDEEQRRLRIKALLTSVLNTFVRLNGAHRNTQMPHLVNLSGVIATSDSSLPAPSISALNDGFVDQIKGTAGSLNKLAGKDVVQTYEFANLSEFAAVMVDQFHKVSV